MPAIKPDPVEVLAGNIDKVIADSGQSFETVMQAMILSAGVRIGIHAEKKADLDRIIEKYTDALTNVAKHRFSTSTKPKSDFDDGNWGPFGSP